MKTLEEIEKMKRVLRMAMMSMKASGAPAAAIERSAVALASAEDTLSWVLEHPSELGRLEKEHNAKQERVEQN